MQAIKIPIQGNVVNIQKGLAKLLHVDILLLTCFKLRNVKIQYKLYIHVHNYAYV